MNKSCDPGFEYPMEFTLEPTHCSPISERLGSGITILILSLFMLAAVGVTLRRNRMHWIPLTLMLLWAGVKAVEFIVILALNRYVLAARLLFWISQTFGSTLHLLECSAYVHVLANTPDFVQSMHHLPLLSMTNKLVIVGCLYAILLTGICISTNEFHTSTSHLLGASILMLILSVCNGLLTLSILAVPRSIHTDEYSKKDVRISSGMLAVTIVLCICAIIFSIFYPFASDCLVSLTELWMMLRFLHVWGGANPTRNSRKVVNTSYTSLTKV